MVYILYFCTFLQSTVKEHQNHKEVQYPIQETDPSSVGCIAPVLKYVHQITGTQDGALEFSEVAEDYAELKMYLFIAKHLTATLQVYCMAYSKWFETEASHEKTDDQEFDLLHIIKQLKILKSSLEIKSLTVHDIKTDIISQLLAHMHKITTIQQSVSQRGLKNLWYFKTLVEDLIKNVKRLLDQDGLQDDIALKFLLTYFIEQDNILKGKIEAKEFDMVAGSSATGLAVGTGIGTAAGALMKGAAFSTFACGGVVVGSIILGVVIGCFGGKFYLWYCKKSGKEEVSTQKEEKLDKKEKLQ